MFELRCPRCGEDRFSFDKLCSRCLEKYNNKRLDKNNYSSYTEEYYRCKKYKRENKNDR